MIEHMRKGGDGHMKIAGLDIKIDRTAYRVYFILALIPFFVIVGYTAMFRTSEVELPCCW
jgi:hypothetical protein